MLRRLRASFAAKLLIAAGARVNDTDAWGVSATVLAAHAGHGEIVDLLLETGADPNAAAAGCQRVPKRFASDTYRRYASKTSNYNTPGTSQTVQHNGLSQNNTGLWIAVLVNR